MTSSVALAARVRGAMLGLAVCDALGAPVEFKKRGTFPLVIEMLPNNTFGTPEGAFTDDTSMALCLAHSLLDNGGSHNSVDQVEKYLAWRYQGYMSSVGECFDVGVSTSACLSRWQTLLRDAESHLQPGSPAAETAIFSIQKTIRDQFNKDHYCGNGSLMRVLPVALIAPNASKAGELAVQSSMTTHPHFRCTSACTLYVQLVYMAMREEANKATKEKLAAAFADVVHHSTPPIEQVLKSRLMPYKSLADWETKPEQEIRSSGYVVDSLEAALWAFYTTSTFQEGAIKVVNLGDDADTVGAIYGGLAGASYGVDAIPQDWLAKMKRIDLLEDTIQKINDLHKNPE